MQENLKHARPSASLLRSLRDDTRGAGLVEYIVLVGVIALIAMSGFELFGGQVNSKARTLGSRVQGIGGGAGGANNGSGQGGP